MSDPVLLTGHFNPRWKTYHLASFALLSLITVAPLPIYILGLPLWLWIAEKQYQSMSCEVTAKFLKYRHGIWTREEKNVPLEQITDLGVVEGPLMRYFGIKKLSVETAGQSSQGALVTLLAIEDAEAFRDDVLDQRDKLREKRSHNVSETDDDSPASTAAADDAVVQRKILETLLRIEQRLSTDD